MIDYDSDAGAWQAEISRTKGLRQMQKQKSSPYGFVIVPEVDDKGEYYAVYSGHTEIAELQDYIGAFRNTKYRNLPHYLWEPADNALLSLNDMETITKLMREIIE